MNFSIETFSFPSLQELGFSPDPYPFLIALCAFALSIATGILFGPILSSPLPFWWRMVDGVFGTIGHRLNRPSRPAPDLAARGIGLALVTFGAAGAIGYGFDRLGAHMGRHFDVNALCLSFLMSTSSVFLIVNRLRRALEGDPKANRPAALRALSRARQTDFSGADDFALARAALPVCIRGFTHGLVRPVFWFIVGGLPAACATSALSALSWRFGTQDSRAPFALMPVWFDRIAGFLPDLLASTLLVLAALFTPGAGFARAIKGLFASKGRAASFQGGRPLSVCAWSLNVSVGGPFRDISALARTAPWVGPEGATARLEPRHLRRFLYLSGVVHLIFLLGLMMIGYTG